MSGLMCLSNFNKACSTLSPNKYKSVAELENFCCQDVAKQSAITKLISPTQLIEIFFYQLTLFTLFIEVVSWFIVVFGWIPWIFKVTSWFFILLLVNVPEMQKMSSRNAKMQKNKSC